MRGPGRVKAKQTVLKCFVPANAGNGIPTQTPFENFELFPCCFFSYTCMTARLVRIETYATMLCAEDVYTNSRQRISKNIYFILFPMFQCVGKIYNFSIVDVYAAQFADTRAHVLLDSASGIYSFRSSWSRFSFSAQFCAFSPLRKHSSCVSSPFIGLSSSEHYYEVLAGPPTISRMSYIYRG